MWAFSISSPYNYILNPPEYIGLEFVIIYRCAAQRSIFLALLVELLSFPCEVADEVVVGKGVGDNQFVSLLLDS